MLAIAWASRSHAVRILLRVRASTICLSMPRATLHKYLKAARKECGVEQATFQTMRHSAASEMINAKVDLYTVGQVLGHKDPRSRQRYAHLAAATLAMAVSKIGQKNPHSADETADKIARAKRAISLAERVGFEPTSRCNREPDFESGAFDHSATSPALGAGPAGQ